MNLALIQLLRTRNIRLILASASPRRRQILSERGYVFEATDPGDIEETVTQASSPEALASEKARAKAQVIAAGLKPPFPAIVIGVDTIVVAPKGSSSGTGNAASRLIGKPTDRADAVAILSRLSGTHHRVISGMCLWPIIGNSNKGADSLLLSESTQVKMRTVSQQEIEAYVASGEADGKAGAYAVQENGDRFIERIEGSFLNIVGFPLEHFERVLPDLIASL